MFKSIGGGSIDEEKNDVFALGVICLKILGYSIIGLNYDPSIVNK